MASSVIHVPRSEAISNISSLLDRATEGADVLIMDGSRVLAILSAKSADPGRLPSESIASAGHRAYSATTDENFAPASRRPRAELWGAWEGKITLPTDAEWKAMDKEIEDEMLNGPIFPEDRP